MSDQYISDVVLLMQSSGTLVDAGNIIIKTFPFQSGSKLFLELNSQIYELQAIKPRRFGAWFINQRVSSSKSLYIASKIDPKFLCLPFFEQSNNKYSPLNQIVIAVDGFSSLPLQMAKQWLLEDICDVNDTIDDELVFYRYNQSKTLKWLKSRIVRIASTLYDQRVKKEKSIHPSFVNNFNISKQIQSTAPIEENTSTDNGVLAEIEDTRQAVDILSEYLSEKLLGLLLGELGMTHAEIRDNKKSHAAAAGEKRKADWEEELEIEKETLAFSSVATTAKSTATTDSGIRTASGAVGSKTKTTVKSNATAAKGTKSIQSFFGAKK